MIFSVMFVMVVTSFQQMYWGGAQAFNWFISRIAGAVGGNILL